MAKTEQQACQFPGTVATETGPNGGFAPCCAVSHRWREATSAPDDHDLERAALSATLCRCHARNRRQPRVKDSGYGREGGTEGLQCYTVTKNVSHKMM
jgi:hypothetical protein